MKALSVFPEWALPIMLGQKTVEWRSWKTNYRGPLLICSSNRPLLGCVHGRAHCLVDLADVVLFGPQHVYGSMFGISNVPDDGYAWVLENVRMVEPVPIKGRQGLYNVSDELVTVLGAPSRELVETHFLPLVHKGNSDKSRLWWLEIFGLLGW